MRNIILASGLSTVLLAGIFSMYVVVVHARTKTECLRKGYPAYKVSMNLERYCTNLSGSVTVDVDKL